MGLQRPNLIVGVAAKHGGDMPLAYDKVFVRNTSFQNKAPKKMNSKMAIQEARKGGHTNNISPHIQRELADAKSQIIQKFQQPLPGPKIALKPKIKTNDPQGAPMTSFSKKLRKPSTYKPNSIDRTHVLK